MMPARRTSRRLGLLRRALIALAACTASFGAAPGAYAAGPSSPALPRGESLLFVMHAESGSLVRRSGNRYTLTLRDSARQTTWFADRPARDAGRVSTRSLVRGWSRLGFSADPPNAVLSTSGNGAEDVVLELGRPRVHRPGLTLRIPARVLGPRPSRRHLRFGLASLFIDNASLDDGCGYTGQISFFPERLTPRQGGLTPADGRSVSIDRYSALARVLGTRFGGDGTSFKLPDVPAPAGLQALICASGEAPSSRQPPLDRIDDAACEPGRLLLFAQETTVWGHLPADGRVRNIRDDPGLFLLLHTEFGGDGSFTFAVPNLPAPPGMSWQICRFASGPAPSCIVSEVGYQAMDVIAGAGSRRLPAEGRLYPVAEHTTLFSLLGDTYGGDASTTFGVPAVADPVPGVHAGICDSGSYPELSAP